MKKSQNYFNLRFKERMRKREERKQQEYILEMIKTKEQEQENYDSVIEFIDSLEVRSYVPF